MSKLDGASQFELEELGRALRILVDEAIGDMVYTIRDREMRGWEGPRVEAFGWACQVVEKFASDPDPAELKRREGLKQRHQQLTAERERVERELEGLGNLY